MRAAKKAMLVAGVMFSLKAAAMARNISNTRDSNGNLVRGSAADK